MQRQFIAISIFIISILSLGTASGQSISRQEYIDTYKDIAISAMKTHGIPASITLAQACLESNNGNSELARKANNHFGIKCHNDWNGDTYYRYDDDPHKSCFRKYKNAKESFEDHSDFLRYRDRYSFLFDLDITDYKGWCYGLKEAGYATSSDYARNLIKIIEDYKLYQYDRDIENIIPPSPAILETVTLLEPVKTSPMYKYSRNRKIYVKNKVPFIIAGDNETYESIAKEYNLFTKELLSFNDLKKDRPITPGTIIYIQRKKNKAARHIEMHIAIAGDTYYNISQRYGVKLSKLFRYNDYSENDILHPGDKVYLRRKR